MASRITPRDLAYSSLLGAAALLLPVLFHMVQLGRVFMPMYLPLVLLAFLVRPGPAALTATVTPLVSAALTGMPPWYPPVAPAMAVELGAMSLIISVAATRFPRANPWLLLGGVLLFGRLLYVVEIYAIARTIELPADFMAGLSLISGWPGLLLMMAVVPPLVRQARARRDTSGRSKRRGQDS